jgi:NADH-ubiquinone oxidoreductase chain 2
MQDSISISKSDQYSLIAIFSILGGSLLMSSLDLLSMYLSIELQSFALYILATLNKERLSSTSAGLKYFLLGSLSSCFILLGSAIIYSYTGLTQFEAINTLLSVPPYGIHVPGGGSASTVVMDYSREGLIEMLDINKAFTIGIIIIIIGFLFKISAAPFYQWAPDVYDGTPTIVTV